MKVTIYFPLVFFPEDVYVELKFNYMIMSMIANPSGMNV